jgi:DNA repair protein RadC
VTPCGIEVPAYRLQLQRTGSVISDHQYADAGGIVQVVRQLIGDPAAEHFVAVFVDAQMQLVGIQLVAVGTVNTLHIPARDIFTGALLCNAFGVVLAHNHPTGDPTPSRADELVTAELETAGCVLGIPVFDHVILGHPGYVSLRALGRMMTRDPAEPYEQMLVRGQVTERAKRALADREKAEQGVKAPGRKRGNHDRTGRTPGGG